MPMPRWMIHRLRESMGDADRLELTHQEAVGLGFRSPGRRSRGAFVLTRDMLNSIPPEPEPDPAPRRSHGYVLKNGIYQA